MCCPPGSFDGKFGAATKTAVIKYQGKKGLTADGIVGNGTWNALVADIKNIQTLLKAKGYYSGSIDGIAGSGAYTAVVQFQSLNNLTADGMVGSATLAALQGTGTGTGGATGPYITAGVNGWLKLYKAPTSSKAGRTVTIPSVSSFTGTDGYQYSFTNKNYWYAYENPYDNKLNPYAISRIKSVTGANPVVNVGSNGEYTDEHGNYWMAVGPKVLNPAQTSGSNIDANKMYGLGKLDVVVKNSSGALYYIPGIIGDIKAHTWDNGVIQTFKAYPNGAFTSAGGNFNGTVCAEFIGALGGKLSGLNDYA